MVVLASLCLASGHHVLSSTQWLSSTQLDAVTAALAAGGPAALTRAVLKYNMRLQMKSDWRVFSSRMSSKVARLLVSVDLLKLQNTADHDTKLLMIHVLDAISPLQLGQPQSFVTDMITGDFHQAPEVLKTVNEDLQATKVCNEDQIDIHLLNETMTDTLEKLLNHDLSPLESLRMLCLDIIAKPLPDKRVSRMSSKVARLLVSADLLKSQSTADHDTKLLMTSVLDVISPLWLGQPQSFVADMSTGDFNQAPEVLETVNEDLQAIQVCNEDQIDINLLDETMTDTLTKLLNHDLSPLESLRMLCLDIIAKPSPDKPLSDKPLPSTGGKHGVFLRNLHKDFLRGMKMCLDIMPIHCRKQEASHCRQQ